MTPEQLAAIRERAEQATPGPWTAEGNPNAECCVSSAEGICIGGYDAGYPPTDAVFIAAAREDIPKLLDRLAAVRELHKPVDFGDGDQYCDMCVAAHPWGGESIPYPCPTVKAVDGT